MHVCSVPAAGRYISLYSFLSRFNCMNSRAYMSSLQTGSQGGRKIIRRAPRNWRIRRAKRLGFPGAYSQVMACSISMYCTMWFELTCNDWYYFRNKIEISKDKSHCNAYYTQLAFFKRNFEIFNFWDWLSSILWKCWIKTSRQTWVFLLISTEHIWHSLLVCPTLGIRGFFFVPKIRLWAASRVQSLSVPSRATTFLEIPVFIRVSAPSVISFNTSSPRP